MNLRPLFSPPHTDTRTFTKKGENRTDEKIGKKNRPGKKKSKNYNGTSQHGFFVYLTAISVLLCVCVFVSSLFPRGISVKSSEEHYEQRTKQPRKKDEAKEGKSIQKGSGERATRQKRKWRSLITPRHNFEAVKLTD